MNLGPLDPRRIALHALMRRGANRGSRRVQTVPEYLAQVAEHPEPIDPPAGLAEQLGLTVVSEPFGDTPAWQLRPEPRRPQAFVYLHGGSYIAQINAGQWKFAAKLAALSGCTGVVSVHPLAPEETAEHAVPRAARFIAAAADQFGWANLTVVAESAGGGSAVAAVQHLRDAASELPASLVLIAPWLDATMTHPDQQRIIRHDIIARPEYLMAAVRTYAGDLPLDDPRVSPLFGNLTGLPPMHVFTGSHDIVATDSRALVERVRGVGGQIEYVEAAGMQHGYPLLPLLPEAKRDTRRMAALIRSPR